jgi:hypothetical protein
MSWRIGSLGRTSHVAGAAACRSRLWLSGLAAAACLVAANAWAAPLPAATSFVECGADADSSFDAVFCEHGNVPSIPGFATATAFAESPFVAVRASEPSNGPFGSFATATLSYHFQVVGGNPGDIVPIRIQTSLHTDSSPQSIATATLTFGTAAVGNLTPPLTVCSGPASPLLGCIGFQGYSGAVKTQTRSGSVDDFVALRVTASAVATRSSDEWALATADPYIFVDPDFPDANLYGVVVSPGVGNAAPVPEPGTLSLLGTSLGFFALLGLFGPLRARPEG